MAYKIWSWAVVLLLSVYSVTPSATLSEEEASFITKHALPDGPLKDKVDKVMADFPPLHGMHGINREHDAFPPTKYTLFHQAGFVPLKEFRVFVHYDLPEFLIKRGRTSSDLKNIGRIYMADKMRECIKKFQMQNIVIPQKYLYHLPGKPARIHNENYVVLSEKLALRNKEENLKALWHLPKQTVQELLTLIKECGYHDSHAYNIACLPNREGIVAIIDTEPQTHSVSPRVYRARLMQYLNPETCAGLGDL